ncbi:Phosphoesterase [Penicillium expansum]|uniref:acid phosphatase n=1 Tax=Penicillium expansum TaxID=27334 RepID=A0A0A2IIM8_PENEN|nr:Phosphoesterase [Penicillium expansum]KGO42268.1 Phosphoesterase [Penicillium expansum]KGO56310.1 Phosphoesterase [Penicillium expansum]KGO66494.1 Phosphoesterase [Penicillium expansum]
MFTKQTLLAFVGALSLAAAKTTTEKTPTQAEIDAARATVLPYSPVSNVKGLVFDRFVNIWLENTDFETAASDENLSKLAKEGILLTNYFAVTHPSEPNYCASAGGDTFGMDSDNFLQIPANVSTIADLFDTKHIAWGEYQEDMPYAGYQGMRYPLSGPNQYVRKHNPLVLYDSVTDDAVRPRQIKNFTTFYEDLEHHSLPQHMFITPNMTNDAHDTDITVAGDWVARFLPPLLRNEHFNKDSLVLLTFDEGGNYSHPNRVFSFLVGGAIPKHLKGTTDDTFYTHYSIIASLSANWGLPSLGRWDCGANLLKIVAEKTGYVNWEVDTGNAYINQTYPGPLSTKNYSSKWAIPATKGKCSAGHGIAEVVKKTYHGLQPTYDYTSPVPYDATSGNNVGIKYHRTLKHGKTESGITG